MANPDKGEFEFVFGTERLTFKVGTSALMEAQEQVGRATNYVPTLEELLDGVIRRQRLTYIQAFIWAGLRKYHPEKTLEDVVSLLDAMTQEQSIALLQGLTASNQPDPKDVQALESVKGHRPRKAQAPKVRATGAGGSTLPRAASA